MGDGVNVGVRVYDTVLFSENWEGLLESVTVGGVHEGVGERVRVGLSVQYQLSVMDLLLVHVEVTEGADSEKLRRKAARCGRNPPDDQHRPTVCPSLFSRYTSSSLGRVQPRQWAVRLNGVLCVCVCVGGGGVWHPKVVPEGAQRNVSFGKFLFFPFSF